MFLDMIRDHCESWDFMKTTLKVKRAKHEREVELINLLRCIACQIKFSYQIRGWIFYST